MTALENVVATPISLHQCARVQAPRWPLVGSFQSDSLLLSGHKMATKQILAVLLTAMMRYLHRFPRDILAPIGLIAATLHNIQYCCTGLGSIDPITPAFDRSLVA